MTDESSSLLASPRKAIRRPPLYSIQSSLSLRSVRSVNNLSQPLATPLDDLILQLDKFAYWLYYCPILRWLPDYNFGTLFLGDLLAGVSMASFQIPLVMSITSSLAHLSPIYGLYSIIAGAFTYAVMGSVPVLVVGPSPSLALIYGQLIEFVRHYAEFEAFSPVEISAALSVLLLGILLATGLFRFGFLDNILSRALLKGFIGAMGLIMIINELAIELGLTHLDAHPHSTIDKLWFVVTNIGETHRKTFAISSITLVLMLVVRHFKNTMVNKYKLPSFIYIPDLLLMVGLGTYLCHHYGWYKDGVEIVGEITTATTASSSPFVNPLSLSKLALYKHVFTTSFLCTVLGYVDHTTAFKALGAKYNYNVLSNRELVALGATNFFVALFGGLPCFGALGRSKINILSGATTPMALIVMGSAVTVSIFYLLPLLYYLPECVLALSTTIIGITVLEEVPHDLQFFVRIGGYDEISAFFIIFLGTVLWSAEAGIVLGVGVAVVRIIRLSSRSRIHILGRVPNTTLFRNADELVEERFHTYQQGGDKLHLVEEIEEIEGILVVRIPEPLNFANVTDLRNRLSRLEKYGSVLAHPSQPGHKKPLRSVIIDCKGMDTIDSSATQALFEIVSRYCQENVLVCFSRLSTNQDTRLKLNHLGITKMVNEAALTAAGASSMGPGFYVSIEDALAAVDAAV